MARQLTFIIAALLAAQAHAAEPGQIVFVAGQAEVEGDPARVGATVQDGDRLRTGGDGYLYIRTADQRLVIVRPETEARFAREMSTTATQGNLGTPAFNTANLANLANTAGPTDARGESSAMAGTMVATGVNPDLDARKSGDLQAK